MGLKLFTLCVFLLFVFFEKCLCLDNGLALTPPMGWLSWQRYRCQTDCEMYPNDCVNEDLIKRTANYMISEGYKDLGYEYVIIDDCWLANERDKNGRLQPDPKRFPSGIKALADYVHSKGLKFGIYEDYGTKTCAGYPGIYDHLEVDAQTFAEWGVDYTKIDGCNAPSGSYATGYPEFGKALNKTGRPIVYSCSWPAYSGIDSDYDTIAKTCNLWRNYGDITDSWGSAQSIMNWFGDNQNKLQPLAKPGQWNDPDMLLVGNFGLSEEQSRTQMSIWAILAAPLIMSNNLANIKPEYKAILQNKDIIAINQDRLGIAGKKVYSYHHFEVWTKPVEPIINGDYSYGMVVISHEVGGQPLLFTQKLSNLGLNASLYEMQDLYDPEKSPEKPTDTIEVIVPPSGGSVTLRATPVV